jgi:hypothetical protein
MDSLRWCEYDFVILLFRNTAEALCYMDFNYSV